MRQLRFVRVTEDAAHLVVETPTGDEQFTLANDAVLREALGTPATSADVPVAEPVATVAMPAVPPPAPAAPPVAPVEFSPRDIQVRVRAGESPQELAESLGVPVERIMRFAGPVMDERLRITDEARRARARRTVPDGAESKVVVFGETVDARFTAHGIPAADVTWDSRRRDDGDWVVRAQWLGGEGTHTAEWVFVRGSRSVTPIDDAAGDLLSDRPIRLVTPVEPERPTLAAAPPLAPGVFAFPPRPDAHTGPLPRYEEFYDQEAASDGPRDVPPLVPAAADLEFDEPQLPLAITDPSTRPGAALSSLTNIHRHRESDEDRAARSRIPSWDDILLGVRRKQD